MNQTEKTALPNLWRNLAITALAALFLFSLHLAINRIFQVDEAQNVYMSRVVALGETHQYFTNGSLFLLGPLSWIASHAGSSVAIFTWDRLIFLAVFWTNILLIALNTGAAPKSRAFLYASLAAASLAPLWDYGFEIRHDNVMLLILLSLWWLLRHGRLKAMTAYFCIGFLSGIMQFVAFKAFLYWLPIGFIALLCPPPNRRESTRAKLAMAWVAGLIAAVVFSILAYKATGSWSSFLNGFRTSIGHSENLERFSPWFSINRLPLQAPLLTAMAVGMTMSVGRAFGRDWRTALTWDGPTPEVALSMGTFLILLINPVPYPYNLVLVVPFMFLAASAWVPQMMDTIRGNTAMAGLAISIIAFTHALPFGVQTVRHLDFTNARQEQLMTLAESMTDPKTDPVYDAAGLVPTRESIHYQWFLHSLVMPKIESGQLPTVRAMLAADPPSVIMPNYRLDWLGAEDRAYIGQHYLPLSDDFFVLGTTLPSGGGQFNCIHKGRYTIVRPSEAEGIKPGVIKVDGQEIPPDGIIHLETGLHQITGANGMKLGVVWLGPTLNQITPPSPADHRALFINWY